MQGDDIIKNINIFQCIKQGNIERYINYINLLLLLLLLTLSYISIEKLYDYKNDILFIRNDEQDTPLAYCLRYGNHSNWNNKNHKVILEYLLNKNASASCFVKGYLQDSLVCTLPMAVQPSSTCFDWPSPIILSDADIFQSLDDAIAKHIETLKDSNDQKIEDQAKQLELQLNCNKDDGRNLSLTGVIASNPSNLFDFYPKVLSVGDRVRRGVNFTYGDQDVLDDIQREGVVTSIVTSSKSYVVITWLRNHRDLTSTFETPLQYYYYPGKLSVFKVDINDRNAYPSNVKKPFNYGDGIKIGDLVSLADRVTQSSFVSESGFADNCLLTTMTFKVGVIVEKSDSIQTISPGIKDYVVKVMELQSGVIMKYAMKDLQFADGSSHESNFLNDKVPRGLGKAAAPSSQVGVFKKGDRVKLSPEATVVHGCLHRPASEFVGVVNSVTSGSISVICNDANGNSTIAAEISGNYPNYAYSPQMLTHEFENDFFNIPLIVGDIVEFNNSFYENHKEYWNLGPASNPSKGIVTYGGICKDYEQRDIKISSLDSNFEASFRFRSSWLRRVFNDGRKHFRVGDRVRLDIGHRGDRGKCLGNAIFGYYGIIIIAIITLLLLLLLLFDIVRNRFIEGCHKRWYST